MRRSDRKVPRAPVREEYLPDRARGYAAAVPQSAVAVFVKPPFRWWLAPPHFWSEDSRKDGGAFGDQNVVHCAPIEFLLTRFGGRSWLSVPVYSGQHWRGRLHLTARQALRASDARFVTQLIGSSMLVIENIRLLDQLASERRPSRTAAPRARHSRQRHSALHRHSAWPRRRAARAKSGDSRTATGRSRPTAQPDQCGHRRSPRGRQWVEIGSPTWAEMACSPRYDATPPDSPKKQALPSTCHATKSSARRPTRGRALSGGRRGAQQRAAAYGRDEAAIRFLADKDHVTLRIENQERVGRQTHPRLRHRSIYERASALGGRLRSTGVATAGRSSRSGFRSKLRSNRFARA